MGKKGRLTVSVKRKNRRLAQLRGRTIQEGNTMPKKKDIVTIEPRSGSRRAASKEALKQMQRVLNEQAAYESPETLEIPSDDDDDDEVIAIDPAPKKKYRLSHRKSSDGNDRDVIVLKTINYESNNLLLESWTENLSPAQIEQRSKAQKEIEEINSRIETLLSNTTSQLITEGNETALYEFVQEVTKAKAAPPTPSTSQSTRRTTQATKSQGLKLVMDPRSGVVVGTMTPTVAPVAAAPVTAPTTRKRTRGVGTHSSPAAVPAKIAKTTPAAATPAPSTSTSFQPAASTRATEATSIGGLSHGTIQKPAAVVDLTTDDNRTQSAADSREISFNKLQGKTFPSLVVVARPHLKTKDGVPSDRVKLDAKVKAVLMHAPTKFTEWLIQVGVIRSEQSCISHPQTKLKLGMYSDVSKFPFSGGYVWISECCPQRFVSVFSGSIFEGSPHPPSVILKLIYHWACQTNVQNVVQWVKVDNLYIKGVNTWLRATCTAALHSHIGPLGGLGRRVEVGVISLGTTSQDGHQRQVKVEVLGILETEAKLLRLRAVEPLADGDRNYKKRFSKILEPLVQWVHPDSTIVTDLTVDRATLQSMGFRTVFQSTSNDGINNHTIMEYLRRIVPRMFQNTLSLLSRQIIQQFLDELVWREWYGSSPAVAFDNIILHLSEQTKVDSAQNLVQRLNKIAANPFKNWSIKHNINVTPIQPKITETPANKRLKTKRPVISPAPNETEVASSRRPPKSNSPDIPEQMVPLEHYYYGSIEGFDGREDKVNLNVKCSLCRSQFTNNVKLMQHLFTHAHNVHPGAHQCRYCLATMTSKDILVKHVATAHPGDTKNGDNYACVICEGRFYNTYSLGKHMSREHVPSELPYQCGTCRFRCSSHKQVVDHFYTYHDGGNSMQCPFCLKAMSLSSNGRVLTQNLSHFLQHLQKHQKKSCPKKCPKCALWFVQKENIKDHIHKMHMSLRRKAGLVPWPVPRYSIMVPKSRQEEPIEPSAVNISKVMLNDVKEGLKCRECDKNLTVRNHFPSVLNCSNENCQYTTCCQVAMDTHVSECQNFHSTLPVQLLPFKMHCVCGYSDQDGNSMAKHLAVCERKSAYPSEEGAKAATVTHSMLDVLGLVRRPEEPAAAEPPTELMDVDEDDVKIEELAEKEEPKVEREPENAPDVESAKETDAIDVNVQGDAEPSKETNEETMETDTAKSPAITEEDKNKGDDQVTQENKENMVGENVVDENGVDEGTTEKSTVVDESTDVEKLVEKDDSTESMDVNCGSQMSRNLSESNDLSVESMVQ